MARDESWARTQAAFARILDRITPWLLDLGSWIFGAEIAFSLVMLGALFTIGPADRAVLIGTAAFALQLPPAAAGFVLLRLMRDIKRVDLERVATEAFVKAGFQMEEESAVSPRQAEKRRARAVLIYSYALLALTLLLTLTGITAVLWHMAWWIAVLFLAMVVASQLVIARAIVGTGSDENWSPPARVPEQAKKATAARSRRRPPGA